MREGRVGTIAALCASEESDQVVAGVSLLASAACSSGGPAVSLTPGPSSPVPSAAAATKPGDFLFRGIVREVNRGCEEDGECSVTVDVTENFVGGLPVGQRVTVIDSYGESLLECLGRWPSDSLEPQYAVEVLAHVDARLRVGEDQRLAICADGSYYIDVIATPTPRICGILACPPTPTPSPTP